jgi:transitional endoplasmic reticulum ATPase
MYKWGLKDNLSSANPYVASLQNVFTKITDDASRKRIKDKVERLTMEILEFTIAKSKPSISISDLETYNEIKSKMDVQQKNKNERPKIGF